MKLETKAEPFPSFEAMRAVHSQLLRQYSLEAASEDSTLVQQALEFLSRGKATGALLDSDADRDGAQTMLDYWSSRLYRMGVAETEVLLDEFDVTLAPEIPDELCPYRGLNAFKEEDAEIFFGRRKTLEEMVARFKDSRLLTVIGPSGSGKSSVVRAGLLPMLRNGAIPGSEQWVYLPVFVPGSTPLKNMLMTLSLAERGAAPEAEADTAETPDFSAEIAALVAEPGRLVQQITERLGVNVVMVIDQFEEIFTLCDNETERRAFVEGLLALVQTPDTSHRVIITMRVDFEPKLAIYPQLQEAIEANTVRLTPLTAADLREAIEEPARRIGLKFEEGLIDHLLNDILGEPAALPLLQFTLLKLWENRDRNRITWEDYRRLGGGRQALARSADELYNSLIPEDQVTARRLLLRLVRPGEGMEVTSQRMRRVDLYSRSDAVDRIDRVLQKFIDARLLRLTRGATPFDDQIEVAHEALVRNWPTLVGWLEDEREALRQRRRLTAAAERWNEMGCSDDLLLRGVELEEALRYDDLNELENNFIKASQQARADEIEKAQQVANELRRRNRIITAASIVAGMVAVVAIFMGLLALNRSIVANAARQQAEHALETARLANQEAIAQAATADAERLRADAQRQTAEAAEAQALREKSTAQAANTQIVAQQATERALVTENAMRATQAAEAQQIASVNERVALARQAAEQARALVSRQTDLGLLLGLEAARLGESLAEKGVLLDVLRVNPPLQRYLQGHTAAVNALDFRPDGRMLGTVGADLNLILWSFASPDEAPTTLTSTGKLGLNAVQFSPTNDLVAVGGCAALDRSGTCSGGLLELWDLTDATFPVTTMTIHRDAITSLAFDRSGQQIVTGAADGVIHIWATPPKGAGAWSSEPRFSFTGQTGAITDLAFTPNGRYLISSSRDGTTYIRDLAKASVVVSFIDHKSSVNAVAVSPDGRYLATGGDDSNIFIYDLTRLVRLAQPLSQQTAPITALDFSPDGLTLVSASEDSTLVLWDLSELAATGRLSSAPKTQVLQGHSDAVLTVKFHPDGKRLASGGRGSSLIEWATSAGYPLTTSFAPSSDAVLGLGFSPAGDRLLVARANRAVTGWDLETGLASEGAQWTQLGNTLRFPSNVGPLFFQPNPGGAFADPDGLILGLRQNRLVSEEVLGVDASVFSGEVNWVEVRQAGYRFAFVKATEGEVLMDRNFEQNWAGLKEAGLIRGAYHFFRPSQDAIAQAEFFAKTVAWEAGDLPPVVDVEQDEGLPGSEVLAQLQLFLTRLEELTQRKPIIYTIPYFWENLSGARSAAQVLIPVTGGLSEFFNPGDYPLWVANYTTDKQPLLPSSWGTWTFWQFSGDAEVPGFPNRASLSRFNGSLQALESFANNQPLVSADPGVESTSVINLETQELIGVSLPLLNLTSAALSLQEPVLLAVGAANGSITLWDLQQGRQTGSALTYGSASIDSLAFSADGRRLAAGTADGNVLLWDLLSGESKPVALTGHASRVLSLAFSQDGTLLASGGADGGIVLWDLNQNSAIGQPLVGPVAAVAALAMNPGATLLAAGYADGSVLLWNIDPQQWEQRACWRAGRNLTETEWERYLPGIPYRASCP